MKKNSEIRIENGGDPHKGNSRSSKARIKECPQPCNKEPSNETGLEHVDYHGKHSPSSHGKSLHRPGNYDEGPNESHAINQSYRQVSDSYPCRTPQGYAEPQVSHSMSWPNQQPAPAQPHASVVPYHRHFPLNTQQLAPELYPSYPGYAAQPVLGVFQQTYRSGYPYSRPQMFSSSYPVPQPNRAPQGSCVSRPGSAPQMTAVNQPQATTQNCVQQRNYVYQNAPHHPQPGSLRKSSSEPPRTRPSEFSQPTFSSSGTHPTQHADRCSATQEASCLREADSDPNSSKYRRGKSDDQSSEPGRLESSDLQTADMSAHAPSRSEIPALALVGNPGAGKSTILNGVANNVVFAAGISIGSGMTTSLNEYGHNGVSLFDTPGLADVEHRKKAGKELNKLLSKEIPLSIAFVVTLERGRVRPEDALTIELVLDSIKTDTDNMFGVIINRVTARVREEMEASPKKEAKIRCSLTGNRTTPHWCYVDMYEDLEDESDRQLMTPELEFFFSRLPETKPRDARTVPIDTDSMEEKLEKHMELIKDIETANEEQLSRMTKHLITQKERYAAQEAQLRRDEQTLVKEIQRLQAEATATRAAAERAERESRRGAKHRGGRQGKHHERLDDSDGYYSEHAGSVYKSRTSTQGHVPAQDVNHHMISGGRSSDVCERTRHETRHVQSRFVVDINNVPIVEGISEEEDLRYGYGNIDEQRDQVGSAHREDNYRNSIDVGFDSCVVNNKKCTSTKRGGDGRQKPRKS